MKTLPLPKFEKDVTILEYALRNYIADYYASAKELSAIQREYVQEAERLLNDVIKIQHGVNL